MITITKEDFLKKYGINLEIELASFDDETHKVERFINICTEIVYSKMQENSARKIPNDKDLNTNQVTAIKNAICDYGMYYLRNGDLFNQSGFDETKGVVITIGDLERIQFPKYIIDNLRRAGLIRKNIGGSYIGGYYG